MEKLFFFHPGVSSNSNVITFPAFILKKKIKLDQFPRKHSNITLLNCFTSEFPVRPCNDLCLVKHCTKALPTFISVESAAVFLFWAVSLWEKKDVFCNSLTHFQVYFIVDISVDQWERSVFSWSELWLVKLPLWADHSPLLQSFIINVSLFKASLKKQHSCSFTLASFSSTNTVLLAVLSGFCH